jgi:hypothetical protein
MKMTDEKTQVLEAVSKWIHKKPGLDPRNYGTGIEGFRAYQCESRAITKDLHDARSLLAQVGWRGVTAEHIIEAAKQSYSGRLTLQKTDQGYEIDYCTGQYWPTEYRRAVCVVMRDVLWDYFRQNLIDSRGKISCKGELQAYIKREVGSRMFNRWFKW